MSWDCFAGDLNKLTDHLQWSALIELWLAWECSLINQRRVGLRSCWVSDWESTIAMRTLHIPTDHQIIVLHKTGEKVSSNWSTLSKTPLVLYLRKIDPLSNLLYPDTAEKKIIYHFTLAPHSSIKIIQQKHNKTHRQWRIKCDVWSIIIPSRINLF